MKAHMTLRHLGKDLFILLGLVLVWRGGWYMLDEIDKLFFSGSHAITAVLGLVLGLIVLYLPDRDLKEIEKL